MTDDNMLSQEEINALLNMANDVDEDLNSDHDEHQKENGVHAYLTPLEIDALGEIGNISLGSSATTLSTILNQKVEITTPSVSVVRKTGLKEEFPYEHVKLQVNYLEGFNGENIFLMKTQDAAIISDIMLGGDGSVKQDTLTEIELSAVQEAMNQMMGSSATSMSTVFDKKVDISPPLVDYEDIDKLEEVHEKIDDDDEVYVRIMFNLKVGDIIDSSIMQLIPMNFAKELVDQLLNSAESAATAVPEVDVNEYESTPNILGENPSVQREEQVHQQMPQQMASIPSEPQLLGETVKQHANVQTASFSAFEPVELSSQEKHNLDLLLDIPLTVTVELGRTKQKVEDILDLTPGSIIELDKLAGEPVDVLVNNKLIAQGEVVVIDENFGVRITDILSAKDRLLKIN